MLPKNTIYGLLRVHFLLTFKVYHYFMLAVERDFAFEELVLYPISLSAFRISYKSVKPLPNGKLNNNKCSAHLVVLIY